MYIRTYMYMWMCVHTKHVPALENYLKEETDVQEMSTIRYGQLCRNKYVGSYEGLESGRGSPPTQTWFLKGGKDKVQSKKPAFLPSHCTGDAHQELGSYPERPRLNRSGLSCLDLCSPCGVSSWNKAWHTQGAQHACADRTHPSLHIEGTD